MIIYSFPPVSPPGGLPFQDHLLRTFCWCEDLCVLRDLKSDCQKLPQCHPEWPAISRPSLKYNSTNSKWSFLGDLNNDQAVSSPMSLPSWLCCHAHFPRYNSVRPQQWPCKISWCPQCHHWATCYFTHIFWVLLYWLKDPYLGRAEQQPCRAFPVSPLCCLLFQEHLPSITLPTWRAVYWKTFNSDYAVSPSSYTKEWPAISRLSHEHNSTASGSCVQGDINNDHAISPKFMAKWPLKCIIVKTFKLLILSTLTI